MAFEKDEIKQLKELFDDNEKKINDNTLKVVNEVVDRKINELAIMTAKGFSEMDDRFRGVDKRFEEVNKQFKEVNQKLDNHSRELSDIRFKMTETVHKVEHYQLEERVKNLENKLKIA
jgi:hypothetical protein